MRVTVRYEDGSVEEFDTNALTTDSALGRQNAVTDMHVSLGDGLWVDASWYRVPTDTPGGVAERQAGCRIHLLSEEEVCRVRSIELEGRLQWLRVGPDLCDVARLDELSDLMHEGPALGMAGRVVWLHDALKKTLPATRDAHERTLAMLGMTEASFLFMSGVAGSLDDEEDSG